jgi:hypothetical protein
VDLLDSARQTLMDAGHAFGCLFLTTYDSSILPKSVPQQSREGLEMVFFLVTTLMKGAEGRAKAVAVHGIHRHSTLPFCHYLKISTTAPAVIRDVPMAGQFLRKSCLSLKNPNHRPAAEMGANIKVAQGKCENPISSNCHL